MEQRDPAPTPVDATLVTEEQRERQRRLDHRNDDPDAPGGESDRNAMADEASR